MVALLTTEPVRVPLAPWHEPVDEMCARVALRRQIADLERRLGDAVAASFPDGGIADGHVSLDEYRAIGSFAPEPRMNLRLVFVIIR